MVLKIIEWNNWQKPIHFALTVPVSNRTGVDPYLAMAGMVVTLRPEKNPPVEEQRIEDLIFDTFQLRSLIDPEVYQDENTTRLLGNYRAIYAQLAGHYEGKKQADDLLRLAEWGEAHLPLNWHTVYLTAQRFERLDRPVLAATHMEKAGQMLLKARDTDSNANYDNLVTIADLIHDRYRDPQRAANLYREAIQLDQQNPDAHYGLAASLQALDQAEEGLRLVEAYMARYGEEEKMVYARQILRNALGLNQSP
jgi:tetratricopeptide (TPR) repeat protein